MDEKETKILEAFRELREHGYGQVTIKFQEDDHQLITKEKWKKNPTPLDIQTAIEDTLTWGFGSVETFEIGTIGILKQIRKKKI